MAQNRRKSEVVAGVALSLLVGFAYALQHINLPGEYDSLVLVGRLFLLPGIIGVAPLAGIFGYSLHNATDLDWLMAIVSWLFYMFLFVRVARAVDRRRSRAQNSSPN